MKRLIAKLHGWPCTLEECEPGHFIYEGNVGFKTEYRTAGEVEVYNEAGEFFCVETAEVQPIVFEWEEYDV